MGAVAQLLVRKLIQTERSATIVLYFLLSSSLISLATIPFGWVMPSPIIAACLVGAGLCGGIAQVLLTESYRHTEMSVVAPFEYSSLVFSVIIGFVFFGDMPTWFMLIGGAIVVGSGLFIIYREHRLGLDRTKVREVVTPQGLSSRESRKVNRFGGWRRFDPARSKRQDDPELGNPIRYVKPEFDLVSTTRRSRSCTEVMSRRNRQDLGIRAVEMRRRGVP